MVKGIFLLVLLGGLLSISAVGQCGQRDVGGKWNILISGTKAVESLNLTQSGANVSGRADLQTSLVPYKEGGGVSGKVEGDKVTLLISWRDDRSTISESFTGTFSQDGKISGQARVWALAGSVDVEWTSDRPMKCLYNTVKKLGAKPSAADPPASSTNAPWITAAPNNLMLPPGVATGQSTIVWDGGKDHPYAEIWVKVDNGDEKKLLEQGRGTLPVSVVPGRTYVYILTDAGTTLATVTVRFQR